MDKYEAKTEIGNRQCFAYITDIKSSRNQQYMKLTKIILNFD